MKKGLVILFTLVSLVCLGEMISVNNTRAAGSTDEYYGSQILDDFDLYPYLWYSSDNVTLSNPQISADDPLALPGQDGDEHILEAKAPQKVDIQLPDVICNKGNGVIPVVLFTTDTFDATTVDHTTVTLGDAFETHIDKKTGIPKRHLEDADGDGDMDLVFHFRFDETGLECNPDSIPFNGMTYDGDPITAGGAGGSFGRAFPIGQDWSFGEGLKFWHYGDNTGDTITVELLDNRAPDPGPAGWTLAWSDEFNDPAGTPPDPAKWAYEIGDGSANGIPGWGNAELQYYTDSIENAAADGQGNLVITALEADGSLECYYGTCEYTSARIVSKHKAEFAYGRIETRILVPDGEDGLWGSFWGLGTDIDQVGWPQTGEIDILEYVSRIPDEIFGTIHGPGYSGGNSFGNAYSPGEAVANNYHTFAIEWQPDLIEWYVDGILFHSATPADISPNQWVFNDPIFLLLNLAVGGNFGGPVGTDTVFPQSMKIDYVRVYQGPDTAERFETSFVDNFSGWQEVFLPFDGFSRSADQPAGAPDDGLGLSEVWGYGFQLPDAGLAAGKMMIDKVRLVFGPVIVTNLNNSGAGSLRWAIDIIPSGGTVTFDPSLAGQTISLDGTLWVWPKEITIDGADAPGIVVSGGGFDRIFIIQPGANATIRNLVVTEGYGWQVAGGILNNGALTLDHVTVTGSFVATEAGQFWQGGGGIYNGDGSSLNLIDSNVSSNTSGGDGGGIYSFFNTTTNVVRSAINANMANNVGGGLRILGNGEIVNSTFSGNIATSWYGGAIFITDGVVNLLNTTVVDNSSAPWAPGDIFVGTFTDAGATLTLTNSIVSSAGDNCMFGIFGPGAVTLSADHNNVFTDFSCSAGASDQVVGDPGLEPLADNGGPTFTHALLAGSYAIDAADEAVCPDTDQRGVSRPQGTGCDVGSFERVP